MQQHDSNALIHVKEQRLNMSKMEEVIPRYRSTSLPYYNKEHEDEKLEVRSQNFEPRICYVVEQEAATQSIKMSRGVESILVTK